MMCWVDDAGWWMPLGWLLMVLFWAAVVGLGIWLVSRLVRSSPPGAPTVKGNGALAIARERYAKGEISRDELERIRRDLV